MSIDIVIKQKGFRKKPLPLEVILGEALRYGHFNGVTLEPDTMGEDQFIAYHPDHIGRGISVTWQPTEKRCVALRALTPTTPKELRDLYDMIKRITAFWRCSLEVEGVRMKPQAFLSSYESRVAFERDCLKNMAEKTLTDEYEGLSIFSVMWPLTPGKTEAEQFLADPEAYDTWLHDRQNEDVYFATPHMVLVDDQVIGRYVLSESVNCVLPNKPSAPFGMVDPRTGKALVCDRFEVYLYSFTKDATLGWIEYERFLACVGVEKCSRFDAQSVRVEGLSLAEMEAMPLYPCEAEA